MKTTKMKSTALKIAVVLIAAFTWIPGYSQPDEGGKYGDTPEDEKKCKEYLSLYREYRDQDMYKEALPYWRGAYRLCPASAKTLYTDGVRFYGNILDNIYEDSTKTDLRNAYLDTLMQIYDQRIANFDEEGKVLTYKANDLFKYDSKRAEEANAMFKRSMDLLGNNTDAVAASKYYQTLYEMYRNNEATKSDLLVGYMPVVDILDYNIARLDDEAERSRYEKAKDNLDAFFIKIAECSDIYGILGDRLAETPDDIDLNQKALAVMNKRDCTDDPLYFQVAERVYRNQPTHSAAYSLGIEKLKSKDYTQALKYFQEAADLCGDCIDLNKYYLRAGQTSTILGQTSKARGFAAKILETNPKSGVAYILIGDAIATGAKSCDDGKLGTASAYWLATDYYAKAASVDPSMRNDANQKIASYSKHFPLKTDIFFHGLKAGDTYAVDCMGGENTTVRSRD